MSLGNQDEAEIAKILATRDAWIAGVKAQDLDRLMNLLTDDIVMMHPNRPAVVGKAANRADLVAAFTKFRVDQTAESDETVVAGEWAFDRARVATTLTPISGEAVTFHSKSITLLRRQPDGSWKIARTIGNSDGLTGKTG